MNRLRDLFGGEPPVIAVSLADALSDEQIADTLDSGVDVIELRIDRFATIELDHVVAEVQRYAGLPVLATIRSVAEGGQWAGSAGERLALFRRVLDHVEAIDVELSSVDMLGALVAEARAAGKVVVVSHHDFEATPGSSELRRIVRDAVTAGAEVVKVSVMANSTQDLRALAAFTLEVAEVGVIVIAMGAHGSASRVFFPALGSLLTFARSPHAPDPVPGQLSLEETLAEVQRFYPDFGSRRRGQ